MSRLQISLIVGFGVFVGMSVPEYIADGSLERNDIISNIVGGIVGGLLYYFFNSRKNNQSP